MSVSTQSAVQNICFRIAQLDAIGQQEVFERIERMKAEKTVPPPEPADETDDDPDSWLTPEMRRKAKENRRRLDEEAAKRTPKRSKEELLQLLINLPMPDEETIQRQDEIMEMRKRWKLPW